MRVLVTGGGGFIGSNLVRALVERGDDVRVLDNYSTGNRENLAELANDVEVVEGELRSYERVHAATRGVEVVFHQGALPSVQRSRCAVTGTARARSAATRTTTCTGTRASCRGSRRRIRIRSRPTASRSSQRSGTA